MYSRPRVPEWATTSTRRGANVGERHGADVDEAVRIQKILGPVIARLVYGVGHYGLSHRNLRKKRVHGDGKGGREHNGLTLLVEEQFINPPAVQYPIEAVPVPRFTSRRGRANIVRTGVSKTG